MTDTQIIAEIHRSTVFLGALLTVGIFCMGAGILVIHDHLRRIERKLS